MARRKPAKDLNRRSMGLQTSPKILIVCEGQKTEPDYFNFLKRQYRLNTAQIFVKGDGGSSPKSVYKDALTLYEESRNSKSQVEYDEVYCVYDCDEFTQHAQVKDLIKQKKAFELIFSNPCFEVWFLFHFNSSTKPFAKKGSKTASKQVKSEAEKLLFNYRKDPLLALYERTETAITNARNNDIQNIHNPYTNVYKLVNRLKQLKK